MFDHRDDIESALDEINDSENLQTEISQDNKILSSRDIMEQKNTINEIKSADKNINKSINKNINKNINRSLDKSKDINDNKRLTLKNMFQYKKNDISNDDEIVQPISPEPLPFSSLYPYGALVLEIIDEGVGMAQEDYKKLFKSIVQFNPNELQVFIFLSKKLKCV